MIKITTMYGTYNVHIKHITGVRIKLYTLMIKNANNSLSNAMKKYFFKTAQGMSQHKHQTLSTVNSIYKKTYTF